MLASKDEVIHLSIRRKSEKDIRADILASINHKYSTKLREDEIYLSLLTFTCED
jgi:hypothetical protein